MMTQYYTRLIIVCAILLIMIICTSKLVSLYPQMNKEAVYVDPWINNEENN